jgi:hypothetical protein
MTSSTSKDTSTSSSTSKGKEKFIIPPSDSSDDAWTEADGAVIPSDNDCDESESGSGRDEDAVGFEMVEEDPFEPVYATPGAEADGVVVEALSLDNILPAGSRRRH